MYYTPEIKNIIKQVMQYATSYDHAVSELRNHDIITNRGVLIQIVHHNNIERPLLRWGGNRK